MSDVGQRLFAQGCAAVAARCLLPAEAAARMPAAPQIRPLDVVKAAARKAELDQLWAQAIQAR